MEENLKKKMKWKTTSKEKKWKTTSKNNGRQPQKKMEDEPINQNQPNWL